MLEEEYNDQEIFLMMALTQQQQEGVTKYFTSL